MMSFLLAGKTVRLKQLLLLLAAVAILGVGVHFAHAIQVRRNANDLKEQAFQTEKEGRIKDSMGLLEQYIQLDPSDTDALAKLGLWRAQEAKNRPARQAAMWTLDQVLRRDKSRDDVRRKVAELALGLGYFKDAREHLAVLVRTHPEDPELLQWSGHAEAGAKEYDSAFEFYRKAIKLAPTRIELSLEYAALLRDRFKETPEMAHEEIERLVQADPKAVPARLEATKYYLKAEVLDKAQKHLRYALDDLGCSTEEVFLLGAKVAVTQRNPEEARALLERGRKLYPESQHLSVALAGVELSVGNPKEGRALLQPSVAKPPDNPEELWSLANLLIETGGIAEAGPVIAQLAGKEHLAPVAECLQARVLMRQEKWGEARKALDAALPKIAASAFLSKHVYLLLAECYRSLDSPDQGLDACRRAVERDPTWPPARRALAEVLAAEGKTELAIQEYRRLPESTPDVQLPLARLLLANNLRLPEGERRWQEIDKLLKQLSAKDQEKFETKVFKANALIAKKQLDEARGLMAAERDLDPTKVEPWLFLMQVSDLQGRRTDLLPLIDEAEKAGGRRVDWEIARARYWLRTPPKTSEASKTSESDQAQKELKRLEAVIGNYPPADGERLLAALADIHGALGQAEDAERLWEDLAKRQPKNLRVRFRLVERFYQKKQEPGLLRLLQETREIEGGNGPFTAYGEAAVRLLRVGRNLPASAGGSPSAGQTEALAEARSWLAKAAALRPSWSRVPLLEAQAFEMENLKEEALKKYLLALDRGEDRFAVYRRVFLLMNELHRFAEASVLMRKLPDQARTDAGLEVFAAHLMIVNPAEAGADPKLVRQQALELARKGVKADSKNYLEFLWLGQVALLAQQPQEAERAFRHARDLNDAAPDAWVALILFLTRTNPAEAEAELAKAQVKLTGAKAALALAPAYEALGKLELAEKQYQAALAVNPVDPAGLRNLAAFLSRTGQAAKAEQVYLKILAAQTNAPKETVAWARRSLALNLAYRGEFRYFQEAQHRLEENVKELGETSDDQLTKALVLASRQDSRREAIQLLESLPARQRTLPADIQMLLAQLYEADGNWKKARVQYLALLSGNERNHFYLTLYIRGLLQHKAADEAGPWLDKLIAVAPKALATIELRARFLKDKGKVEEAASLVKAFAQEKDARLDMAALWLEQLGHAADAEKAYRDFTAQSKQPESVLQLAMYLARQKRPAEALDICERAWENCRAGPVAAASVAIVRAGNLSEAQEGRVEGWLVAQQQKQPKAKVALLLFLAEFKEIKWRHEEAIEIYRAILQQDENNVVALNNLAYLLALKRGENTEALKLVERAIALAGPAAEILGTRAIVYLKSNRPFQAIEDLERSIQQEPTPVRYLLLARAQQQAKNRLAAVNAWRKAIETGLDVAAIHPLERADYQRLKEELGQ